jgi:hypothetical protein
VPGEQRLKGPKTVHGRIKQNNNDTTLSSNPYNECYQNVFNNSL